MNLMRSVRVNCSQSSWNPMSVHMYAPLLHEVSRSEALSLVNWKYNTKKSTKPIQSSKFQRLCFALCVEEEMSTIPRVQFC